MKTAKPKPTTQVAMTKRTNVGLPYAAVTRFQSNTALPLDSIRAFIGISSEKPPQRLTAMQSERLRRLMRVFATVLDVFEGDVKGTTGWLQHPAYYFSGKTPLAIAKTERGAEEVEELIGRLDYGIFT